MSGSEAHELPARMFVRGLGTAHPPRRYTKRECWEAFRSSAWYAKLDRRSRALAGTVLLGDNGIEARRLALETLDEVFRIEPNTLHARFIEHAPRLAAAAGSRALESASCEAAEIDAVIVSTCTGYLCPGLSGYVVERLGLRADIGAFDLVGHGCGAALPNWQLAEALLGADRAANVLSVCVEVASAAMYLDDDPGVLVSACLFGDGAGAAVLAREPAEGSLRRIAWRGARTLLSTAEREALKFEQRDGMLRNVLTRPVPALAAEHAARVLDEALEAAGVHRSEIAAWIWHAGGRDVLAALRERLALEEQQLRYSAAVLREYGNLSSAFVYFVLAAALEDRAPPGWWWLSSFGAGFSCAGALLEVA